jgi:hypothetical protein
MMAGMDSSATNGATGVIATSGDLAAGMVAFIDSNLSNEGRITTSGVDAAGMAAGAGSTATTKPAASSPLTARAPSVWR